MPLYSANYLLGAAQKSSGNSGISKGAGKAAGGASGTGGSPAPCGGNTEPGDKVTVTLGGLK